MLTNDILRRVRYALDLNDAKVREIFALAGHDMDAARLGSMFKKEEEAGFEPCPAALAHLFFRGLVILKRGMKDGQPGANEAAETELSNNEALWYLRIALQLKDDDILSIMKKANADASKSELNALFRKKNQKNYRPCGDQFLRNFLAGMTATLRP